jgi:hypothetical protein
VDREHSVLDAEAGCLLDDAAVVGNQELNGVHYDRRQHQVVHVVMACRVNVTQLVSYGLRRRRSGVEQLILAVQHVADFTTNRVLVPSKFLKEAG